MELLTAHEVADRSGLSVSTIRNYIKDGKIEPIDDEFGRKRFRPGILDTLVSLGVKPRKRRAAAEESDDDDERSVGTLGDTELDEERRAAVAALEEPREEEQPAAEEEDGEFGVVLKAAKKLVAKACRLQSSPEELRISNMLLLLALEMFGVVDDKVWLDKVWLEGPTTVTVLEIPKKRRGRKPGPKPKAK